MPLTFSVPDSVLSTTLANYSKTMQDNIFRANPLMYWLIGQYPEVAGESVTSRGQLKVLDGGESIVEPLMYERNSTAKSYSSYGIIDTTPQEGITSARYVWKQSAASISISGKEQRQNAGSNKIIDLLQAKTMQAEMSLKEELNRQAWGTGTDSTTDLTGLQTIVATTGTVGGISRTGNAWWQAQSQTAASFAANGLDTMRATFNLTSRGSDKVDLIIGDRTNFERYEKSLQPQERFTDSKMADGGFQSLMFKATPFTFDLYAPSGNIFFLNSKYLNLQIQKDANFTSTDFVKPVNQDAKIAQILFQGELTASNCFRQGLMVVSAA